MSDLFKEKSKDWDMRDHVKALSDDVGAMILKKIAFTEKMTVMDFGAGTGLICSHLKPNGQIALADLDTEDGHFHSENTEGVYHFGFDRKELKHLFEENGFKNVEFVTTHTIDKAGKPYPVFLLTAILIK